MKRALSVAGFLLLGAHLTLAQMPLVYPFENTGADAIPWTAPTLR